jgi:hypothetical protein
LSLLPSVAPSCVSPTPASAQSTAAFSMCVTEGYLPVTRRIHPAPEDFGRIAAVRPFLRKSYPSHLRHGSASRRSKAHSGQLRASARTNGQTVSLPETMCERAERSALAGPCGTVRHEPDNEPDNRRATMTSKIVLALALAITALASVPASAKPHHDWQLAGNCQEDLGYGRTSGWGCG